MIETPDGAEEEDDVDVDHYLDNLENDSDWNKLTNNPEY
jgi:hypothetical protein